MGKDTWLVQAERVLMDLLGEEMSAHARSAKNQRFADALQSSLPMTAAPSLAALRLRTEARNRSEDASTPKASGTRRVPAISNTSLNALLQRPQLRSDS